MTAHSSSPAAGGTRLLRLALRANAAFSTVCALVFIADARALAPLIGVPGPLLVSLGVGLLGFAALLVAASLRADVARLVADARIFCAADVAWVVGSVPIIALGLLEPIGAVGLAGVSAVVAALAFAQWRGLGKASALRA